MSFFREPILPPFPHLRKSQACFARFIDETTVILLRQQYWVKHMLSLSCYYIIGLSKLHHVKTQCLHNNRGAKEKMCTILATTDDHQRKHDSTHKSTDDCRRRGGRCRGKFIPSSSSSSSSSASSSTVP